MKNKLVYLFALFALPVLANTPPVITNVRAEQRKDTKLVDIYYDAADADNDALKVRIEISDNDGMKYSVPAFTLTGDIGEGITPGTGKHIIWDAGTDWDGEYSDQMRVKVFAVDAQGFPGMEWGSEVPPGGFLMGQDGGAEGSGPSRHVNIPWSYWLSKYEITAQQYCDFLNAAYAAGNIYLVGTSEVRSYGSSVFEGYCNAGATLCFIGDGQNIRWNVNNFEVIEGKGDYPAIVTYCGATAFARFYGYDLPTDAEWEKAARGPDHDDQDEHLLYPWGNTISTAYANPGSPLRSVGYYNGNQTPVGPDTINGYGLYDVIGNAAEWTRTTYVSTVSDYPQQESLLEHVHLPYKYGYDFKEVRVYRGVSSDAIYWRRSDSRATAGFRVVRRHEVKDVKTKIGKSCNFEWSAVKSANDWSAGPYFVSGSFAMAEGNSGYGVKCTSNDNAYDYLEFTLNSTRVCYFTLKVKNTDSVERQIYFYTESYITDSSTSLNYRSSASVALPPNMTEFRTISFDGGPAVYRFKIDMTSGLVIDDLELHTVDE